MNLSNVFYFAKVGSMYVGEIIGERIVEGGIVVGYSSISSIELVENERHAKYMNSNNFELLSEILGNVDFYEVKPVQRKLSTSDARHLIAT